MADYKVLILDDDFEWVTILEHIVHKGGFETVSTNYAEEAIKLGRSDRSIKFALTDEMLYVPPIPRPGEEKSAEWQDIQGQGVIAEIRKHRHDIQFIVVTSAPFLRSDKSKDRVKFLQETNKLKRGIEGITELPLIHKCELDKYADAVTRQQACEYLYALLEAPLNFASSPSGRAYAKVLLGLGFEDEIFDGFLHIMKWERGNKIPMHSFLVKSGMEKNARFLEGLINGSQDNISQATKEKSQKGAPEKKIFIQPLGTNQHNPFKASRQQLKILEILAKKAVLGQSVTISPAEYSFEPRTEEYGEIDPDLYDQRTAQDLLYDHSDDSDLHKPSYSASVEHIAGQTEKNAVSNLKAQISHLRTKLAAADVAPRDFLFKAERGIQRPLFELDIELYRLPKKKSPRKKATQR